MAYRPSMTEVEMMTKGDSRKDLLRKIANLIEDKDANLEHALYTDRAILHQNLHLAHLEKLVKAHRDGQPLGQAQIERAFALANPETVTDEPTVCPDCKADMRHAGFDFWVCDSDCGHRVRVAD